MLYYRYVYVNFFCMFLVLIGDFKILCTVLKKRAYPAAIKNIISQSNVNIKKESRIVNEYNCLDYLKFNFYFENMVKSAIIDSGHFDSAFYMILLRYKIVFYIIKRKS